ncbi:peptidase M3 [Persicobacter psychrovividus]|uniref:Peptidase M3 n=2 Tax=Persicobacter psychrovividus TaxID=387638 RepID=A0ABN6L8D0_9BACT|nr:peptidase M3 [Persicobacter psychrovividus]
MDKLSYFWNHSQIEYLDMTNNPLLVAHFEHPLEAIPFDQIKEEHFLPALEEAIRQGKADIEMIKTQKETPSFENTIVALDQAGKLVGRVSSIFFNLNSAETNEEIQKIAQEFAPKLTVYSNEISMDEALFEKVKQVHDHTDKSSLTAEQQTLLEKTYKSFVRNGALLSKEDKSRLTVINTELSKASLEFGENVLAETNKYVKFIDNKEALTGLPEFALEAAAEEAKQKGKEGQYALTLQYPSYIPLMTYADNRELREELFMASGQKAFKGDELDNQEIIKKIVRLRHEKAQILGYATHADLTLEERMAGTPQTVTAFLQDLMEKAKPVAEEQVAEVRAFAQKNGLEGDLQRWDWAYYAEKLKKEKFAIDDEVLKPYFSLEKVVNGVFETAKRLYGITFSERKDIPVYHEEVTAYEVKNLDGSYVGLFYADFFPRQGKRNGAWMTSYRDQSNVNSQQQRPHISIVCNFTKPTATKPSLLTFNEVTTLFHEFGHALHGLLANTTYSTLSGTSVYWDFVELPSQVMENWAYEKECLDLFAQHYETGENIPMELIQKIKDSANFLEGYQTMRQISFGLLDMAWHGTVPNEDTKVADFEGTAMAATELFPKVEGTCMSTAFSHIFQGGYSAGYYSYKWAEILDADAFEAFKEKGLFDTETAQAFKEHVLSKGGSEHPMILYKRFRGHEPKTDALLKRAGLAKA